VAIQESGGNPRASSQPALGVMRSCRYGQDTLGVTDPTDPVQSIYGGAKH
jgi:membrane-bound lytic murein transglycosylase MltF